MEGERQATATVMRVPERIIASPFNREECGQTGRYPAEDPAC
jgi:hypothetical protein